MAAPALCSDCHAKRGTIPSHRTTGPVKETHSLFSCRSSADTGAKVPDQPSSQSPTSALPTASLMMPCPC
eukprot:6033395-Amphidinium_carterae.1